MERVFRRSFKDSFRLPIKSAKKLFILFSIFWIADLILNGFSFETLLGLIFVSLFLPLMVICLVTVAVFFVGFLFPVKTYSNGISSVNFFGKRFFFQWKELKRVNLANVIGFDYLIFINEDDKRIWIPLLIGDLDLFIKLVLEKTKLLNPNFYRNFLNLIDEEAKK